MQLWFLYIGFIGEQGEDREELFIELVIDDGIFVACIYQSEGSLAHMSEWDEKENDYRYIAYAAKYYPNCQWLPCAEKRSQRNNPAKPYIPVTDGISKSHQG